MLILDVNILLAAHRTDHPLHATVRPWFDTLLASGGTFGLPRSVCASMLRIATSRRVFGVPTRLDDAFEFLDALVAQPGHVAAEPGPRHLALLRRMCQEADATGDLVPDAVLVAVAVEYGAAVASLDRDFARFPVEYIRPE
jgi:uncharacterized protein